MPTPLQIPAKHSLFAAAAPSLTTPRAAASRRSDVFDRALVDVAQRQPGASESRSAGPQAAETSTPEPRSKRAETSASADGDDDAAVTAEPRDAKDDAAQEVDANDNAVNPGTTESARPVAQPTDATAQSVPTAPVEPIAEARADVSNPENIRTEVSSSSSTTTGNAATLAASDGSGTLSSAGSVTVVDAETAGASGGSTAPPAEGDAESASAPRSTSPIVATPDASADAEPERNAPPVGEAEPAILTSGESGDSRTPAEQAAAADVETVARTADHPASNTASNGTAGADARTTNTASNEATKDPRVTAAPTAAARPEAAVATTGAAPRRESTAPAAAPGTVTPGAEVEAAENIQTRGDRSGAESNAGRGDARGSGASEFAERSGSRLSPASARAVQVDAAVQLTNLAGSAPGAEALAPSLGATSNALNAVTSGLRGDTVEQLVSPTSAPNGAAALTSRVVRGLATMVHQNGGVMNMRLTPPELGALRVQMSIVQGVVTADFTASTEQAQSALQRSLGVLRGALEGHGLSVERLAVHVAPSDSGQGARHESGDQANQNQQQQRDSHDAAREESRGRRDGTDRDAPWRRSTNTDFTADLEALTAEFREREGVLAP